MTLAPVSRPKTAPRNGKAGPRTGQRRTAPTRAGAKKPAPPRTKSAPRSGKKPAQPAVPRGEAWRSAPPPFRVPEPPRERAAGPAAGWPPGSTAWKKPFLARLEECGNVLRTCEALGISRNRAYEERDADEDFRREWLAALDAYVERLEGEADDRAVRGVMVPVVGRIGDGQDGVIATERKPSDQLLMFRLKALAPDRYRERRELTGAGGKPLIPERFRATDLEAMSDEELDDLRRKLDELAATTH